jgi:hypothetical protein
MFIGRESSEFRTPLGVQCSCGAVVLELEHRLFLP